jgi:hypothetical protein
MLSQPEQDVVSMPSPVLPVLPGSDLRWYLNRLRCMPLRELPFRLLRTVATHAERIGWRRYEPLQPDLTRAPPLWLQAPLDVDTQPYLAAAERIIAGEFDVFALRGVQLGTPPRWNRDPKTGTEAPLVFGKLLDYRDPRLAGDIKYLWEPNRHLQLVTLAQAYALSGELRYGRALLALVDSWIAACPCPLGPNWASALEPAIRLINWSLAWQLIGGAQSTLFEGSTGEQQRARWLASVYQHGCFVRGYLSRHSSANNHLIAELTGLLAAGATWPHWAQSARWLADSHQLLLAEALRQNAPDGVNREQAVCYQQWECDLLLLASRAAHAAGASFPPQFAARLEAMLEYLMAIMDVGGHVPMFGDDDGGRVVALSQEPGFCPYRSLLATGAVLFGRRDFATRAGHLDDKTRWLVGPDSAARFTRAATTAIAAAPKRSFPEGGYFILGCDFETRREIRLVADAGPIGYGSIAAHGHADALAFTLSVGGHEMLVDPGTYTYRADSPWRRHFRSTAAHNTLRIDELDQSEPGGSFMWLAKAQAGCGTWHSSDEQDCFEGWHDGYTRLADPVLHRRRIVLHKARRQILIEDRLEMKGTHAVELFFHFGSDCQPRADDAAWLLELDGLQLRMRLPATDGCSARVGRGELNPPLGWLSPQFDVLVPASTLVWRAELTGPTVLHTLIEC